MAPLTPHAHYQSALQEVIAGAPLLMGKLVAAARAHLQLREAGCSDLRQRNALSQSSKQLREWESKLCQRFPLALQAVFDDPEDAGAPGTVSLADVKFDELELMDEEQVLTSVALARTLQIVVLAVESSLAELNTLVCSALGLAAVSAERNPLRPQNYLQALRNTLEQAQISDAAQIDWLATMGVALGQELCGVYAQVIQSLKAQGVVAVGYTYLPVYASTYVSTGAVVSHHPGASASVVRGEEPYAPQRTRSQSGVPGDAKSDPGRDSSLLTLDTLRRLLAGEFQHPESTSAKDQFALQFASSFDDLEHASDGNPTDFDATVPAAFEALREMEQVDAVVQRLHQRQGAQSLPITDGDRSVEAIRASLRNSVRGVAQALSLEVITLMVDNLAHDTRLLPPVQQLIRSLEPALLRLALVEPRLFTDKQHPARVLLQEIADRSLAYGSVGTQGFAAFLTQTQAAVGILDEVTSDNAQIFGSVLAGLREHWQEAGRAGERNRVVALRALQTAERRKAMAATLSQEILALADAQQAPQPVLEFLCGPWAQVVASARMAGDAGAPAAQKYHALISPMLWSTRPDFARKEVGELTRLVPHLLASLREGLDTIGYPGVRTNIFFEALMGYHERVFRSSRTNAPKPEPIVPDQAALVRSLLIEDGKLWVAPDEARASNFMDLPGVAPGAASSGIPLSVQAPSASESGRDPTLNEAGVGDWTMGTWIELLVNGQWRRTQLTWANPRGSLFLFTDARGAIQSMTRRLREQLLAQGQMRLIAGKPMVDNALNAVAQIAMRNSVNAVATEPLAK